MGGDMSMGLESQGGGDLGGGGGLSGFGQNLGGIFGGNGQNSGMFGLGQYRTDPYSVNRGAFAPDANEQQYTQQLQNNAYGQGPSPAQLQMQQGLQQATAQSQALAASQRGISPALAARYAAQNQAGMSQNVAQNTGIMRAQEQLNSMNQLGQELQSQRTGRMGLENLQSGNFNYAQGLNEQAYGSAAGHRASAGGGIMSAIGMAAMNKGGQVQKMADGGMPAPEFYNHTPPLPGMPDDSAQEGKDQKNAQSGAGQFLSKFGGGGASGGSGGAGGFSGGSMPSAMAKGGQVQRLSFGGMSGIEGPGWGNVSMNQFAQPQPAQQVYPQQQNYPGAVAPAKQGMQTTAAPTGFQGGKMQSPLSMPMQKQPQNPFASIGNIGSGNGGILGRQVGGMFGAMSMETGGTVPGQAKVKGDSLKNDKVPAMLSPKEIVLPRSITMSPDAPEKAKAFVAAIMARNGKLPGKKAS